MQVVETTFSMNLVEVTPNQASMIDSNNDVDLYRKDFFNLGDKIVSFPFEQIESKKNIQYYLLLTDFYGKIKSESFNNSIVETLFINLNDYYKENGDLIKKTEYYSAQEDVQKEAIFMYKKAYNTMITIEKLFNMLGYSIALIFLVLSLPQFSGPPALITAFMSLSIPLSIKLRKMARKE